MWCCQGTVRCDVASLALGFVSSLSILNRDSLYSREIAASLLCLDCSSKEQVLLPFPQFCRIYFQLHLISTQEKGLHIHPLKSFHKVDVFFPSEYSSPTFF